MVTLNLTEQQVVDLFKQLSPNKQTDVFRSLLSIRWPEWDEIMRYGEARIRVVAAERNKNWDAMTEQEREDFIDDLVHEDR